MVGEGGQAGDLGVAGAQRVGEFPRPANAGEGKPPPPGEAGTVARHQAGREIWFVGQRQIGRPRAIADHRVGPRQAGGERFPERPGRQQAAIAEALIMVDHQQAHGMDQAGVLIAVVHQNQVGVAGLDGAGAGGAVASDPGFPGGGQQQGFVTDVGGVVAGRINPVRSAQPAAIPAAQHGDAAAGDLQLTRQVEHQWRLTGAAGDQIADAHHRQVRAIWSDPGPPDQRAGAQQAGGGA